jgi:AAA+ superfamily predicted ATPase
MACACGMNKQNIKQTITKKIITVQHNFYKKNKEEQLNILRHYIKSKPLHVQRNNTFQRKMVNLLKSL